jgi:hypothetical protein
MSSSVRNDEKRIKPGHFEKITGSAEWLTMGASRRSESLVEPVTFTRNREKSLV